jgi:hypothetical protein
MDDNLENVLETAGYVLSCEINLPSDTNAQLGSHPDFKTLARHAKQLDFRDTLLMIVQRESENNYLVKFYKKALQSI